MLVYFHKVFQLIDWVVMEQLLDLLFNVASSVLFLDLD